MQGILLIIVALYILWLAGSGRLGKIAAAWRTVNTNITTNPSGQPLPSGQTPVAPTALPTPTAGLPGLPPAQALIPQVGTGVYDWPNV